MPSYQLCHMAVAATPRRTIAANQTREGIVDSNGVGQHKQRCPAPSTKVCWDVGTALLHCVHHFKRNAVRPHGIEQYSTTSEEVYRTSRCPADQDALSQRRQQQQGIGADHPGHFHSPSSGLNVPRGGILCTAGTSSRHCESDSCTFKRKWPSQGASA